MRTAIARKRFKVSAAAWCLSLFMFTGCANVGPTSISMGRADYNEVINRTDDEQLLMAIVKGRYGETSSLLAVKGVAANVRFGTRAQIEAGIGPLENFEGNIVPFAGGLSYEENPTITYAPVQGERYAKRLLSPIPASLLALTLGSELSSDYLFTLMVNKVNNLRNPGFYEVPEDDASAGFDRFKELLSQLINADRLEVVGDPRKDVLFNIILTGYAPAYSRQVNELIDLLDLPMPVSKTEDIIIPVYYAFSRGSSWGIVITTRSTFDLIQIARAAVEVPMAHASAGLTLRYPRLGIPGQGIRIKTSAKKPEEASIGVTYRGHWFYIDETDQKTKEFFRILRVFWNISIAEAADQTAAPVLTIPVSN